MRVPLLDLHRQFESIREETLLAVTRVLESQHLILGEEVEAFEAEFSKLIGCGATVGCGSGTDALWLALAAAGISPGDEVLTTPFSFFASTSAIIRAGARPVFADIEATTFNLDPRKVEARLHRGGVGRLRAILPVHLYGQCADMDQLRALADEFKLIMVEDAAQAVCASWRGTRAGALSAAAAFSFYPTKNLSAAGDAGCVTATVELADRLRRLRNHGMPQRYVHTEIGANSRLGALQAAVLRVKMRHLTRWTDARRHLAARYDELLRASGLVGMQAVTQTPIVLPETLPSAFHVFHQYTVRAHRRDELRAFLNDRGIGTEIYYPVPIHMQPAVDYLGYSEGSFPQAESAARQVLSLPIFPELMAEEQRYVVDMIAEFYS